MQRIHAVTTALMLCWGAAVKGQNLITNPSFEAETPSNYWGLWKDSSAAAANAAISFPDSGAPQGTKYARVEVTEPSLENWHIQLQIPPDWIADSGVTYELKFWAKSDSSRSIHVGIQDGPDGQFVYRSGIDFSLSTEWTEYSTTYTSDRQGNGTVRFNLYLGLYKDTYGFDGFSLQAQQPVGIRSGSWRQGQALRVRQESGNLVLSQARALKHWRAGIFDLRGVRVAAATERVDGSLSKTTAPAGLVLRH
jgi:Carbohydrate binding domain